MKARKERENKQGKVDAWNREIRKEEKETEEESEEKQP